MKLRLATLEAKIEEFTELKERYDKLAITAVKRTNEEAVIEIEPISDSEEKYELPPLNVGDNYKIEHRKEDGYINITNLCKAGQKNIDDWKSLSKTKTFLQALSSSTNIQISKLIKSETDSVWVHPLVTINIAQWISPRFDVKISGWIYEVMMTGKVDISNTTSYKKLLEENKNHKFQVKYLTKKYVKKQQRKKIKERNVIYILTTKLMHKERRYIMGKATNLTNRLSTYNKSDEHQVIYYQSCGKEDSMSTVEKMVFTKLNKHREQANRERFILPPNTEISYFIETIKNCINFIS